MVSVKKEKRDYQTMKDPVCGMEVSEKNDSIMHNGKKFHFCCASCMWAFEKNPEQFVKNDH